MKGTTTKKKYRHRRCVLSWVRVECVCVWVYMKYGFNRIEQPAEPELLSKLTLSLFLSVFLSSSVPISFLLWGEFQLGLWC